MFRNVNSDSIIPWYPSTWSVDLSCWTECRPKVLVCNRLEIKKKKKKLQIVGKALFMNIILHRTLNFPPREWVGAKRITNVDELWKEVTWCGMSLRARIGCRGSSEEPWLRSSYLCWYLNDTKEPSWGLRGNQMPRCQEFLQEWGWHVHGRGRKPAWQKWSGPGRGDKSWAKHSPKWWRGEAEERPRRGRCRLLPQPLLSGHPQRKFSNPVTHSSSLGLVMAVDDMTAPPRASLIP